MKIQTLILLALVSSSAHAGELGLHLEDFGGKKTIALRPCEDRPNCQTSFKRSIDDSRYLDPIKYLYEKERAKENVIKIVTGMAGMKIVKNESDYLHVLVTSSFFNFVDDLEFYFGDDKVIHFRSKSQKGYWDMGANKKRIETIRFKFHQNDF